MPVCILQPLVENTIVHGFDEKEEGGYIMINIYAELNTLHVLIADNGAGIPADKLESLRLSLRSNTVMEIRTPSGSSIGLLNVHQRIQDFCGKEYGIKVDSREEKGTIVDLKLPLTRRLEPLH